MHKISLFSVIAVSIGFIVLSFNFTSYTADMSMFLAPSLNVPPRYKTGFALSPLYFMHLKP